MGASSEVMVLGKGCSPDDRRGSCADYCELWL